MKDLIVALFTDGATTEEIKALLEALLDALFGFLKKEI